MIFIVYHHHDKEPNFYHKQKIILSFEEKRGICSKLYHQIKKKLICSFLPISIKKILMIVFC